MNAHPTTGGELMKGAGRFTMHVVAIVLGLVLTVVGLAMGVSIALLPIGVPTFLGGLLLLMWGLFGGMEQHNLPPYPPEKR